MFTIYIILQKKIYDFVSLYPSEMKNNKFPAGKVN